MTSVSVVIPTFNQCGYLADAIDSALTQSAPPLEVIVVDDGSTDETSAVLAGYGTSVRVLCQENAGVARARNVGAASAEGDVLAFLDSDDVWLPRKLERQLQVLASSSQIGLVHCSFTEIDETGRTLATHRDGLAGSVAEEVLLLRRPVVLGGGSGFIVRRAAFESVGGFDERLSTSADWDFFYRIARRWRVGFVPEVSLRYRVHGANMHRDIGRMRQDMLLAMRKAFADEDAPDPRIRHQALGRLHVILAGSYLAAGSLPRAAVHLARGLAHDPVRSMSSITGALRVRFNARRSAD